MKSAFNSKLFTYSEATESDSYDEVTDNFDSQELTNEEYINQRNRTIVYMYKHDYTEDELLDMFSISIEELKSILNTIKNNKDRFKNIVLDF